jgi:hypothetical protein
MIRTVVLYGGDNINETFEVEIGFILNYNGNIILGIKAPEIFKDAIMRLFEFWS